MSFGDCYNAFHSGDRDSRIWGATIRYSVVLYWEDEAQAWTAEVPALDGAATCGDTVEEALTMARELIALNVADMRAHDEPVPVENKPVLVRLVDIDEAEITAILDTPPEPPSVGSKT